MAVDKVGYREQSQCMLSTIMFWNSLLAGRSEACGIICQIARTRILEKPAY